MRWGLIDNVIVEKKRDGGGKECRRLIACFVPLPVDVGRKLTCERITFITSYI